MSVLLSFVTVCSRQSLSKQQSRLWSWQCLFSDAHSSSAGYSCPRNDRLQSRALHLEALKLLSSLGVFAQITEVCQEYECEADRHIALPALQACVWVSKRARVDRLTEEASGLRCHSRTEGTLCSP